MTVQNMFSALFLDVMRIWEGFDPTMNCVQSFTKTRQSDKGWESSSDLCKTFCNDMGDLSFFQVRKSRYLFHIVKSLLDYYKTGSFYHILYPMEGSMLTSKGYWKIWIMKWLLFISASHFKIKSNLIVAVKVIEHWRAAETNPIINQIDTGGDAAHSALQIFQSGKLH